MMAIAVGLLASAAHGQCVGDCDGNGQVAINELIVGVNIALGGAPSDACSSFDTNGDGAVAINELIAGVNNALQGCSESPTPTPTANTTTVSSLDFVVGAGTGNCGDARDAGDAVLRDLSVGLTYVGGGASQAPPIATAQLRARFAVTGCTGTACTLGPTSADQSAPFQCTDTGCPQGVPVVNTNPLPTCSATVWSAPAEGSVDLSAGTASVLLHSSAHTWITTNRDHPCPRCVAGTCDRGAQAGLACSSDDPDGLTNDCIPGGTDGSVDLGVLNLDVTLGTGAQSATTPDGAFCPGQDQTRPGLPGCFGLGDCRAINVAGVPAAGRFLPVGSSQPVTLVTLACVPPTGNVLIDSASDLPGPAVECLFGTITLNP